MGVLCLLLDKKREYFHLLSDIFNITGHKLLVALDEDKAFEFLKVSFPDILLMPLEDMNFWLKLIEKGYYTPPIFFTEDSEGVEKLKKHGFNDLNYMLLPFNPMELLSKVVYLSKDLSQIMELNQLGFANVLLKLLRMKRSLTLSLEGKGGFCDLYLWEGSIKGSNCDKKRILELLEDEVSIKLKHYKEEGAYSFEKNWDFLSILAIEHVEEITYTKSFTEETLTIDLSQPIELREGFYWIGVENKNGLFQKNVYLRIYERDNIKVPILINVGTAKDYPIVRLKLEQVVGSIDAVKGIILLGSEIDEASGIFNFLQSNYKAFIITSMSIANKLRKSGVPQNRIRVIETLPGGRLRLATGDLLKFIPTPFLPGVGNFMIIEEGSGYLFTGRFLSSLCSIEEFNPHKEANKEDVILYTHLNIPYKDPLFSLIKKIESEKVSSIYPMFGKPILSIESLREIFRELKNIFLNIQAPKKDNPIKSCEDVLKLLKENLESAEFEAFLEELNQFVYVEEGKIMQSFVDIEDLPKLIVHVALSRNVNPRLVKEVIRMFYKAGAIFTI